MKFKGMAILSLVFSFNVAVAGTPTTLVTCVGTGAAGDVDTFIVTGQQIELDQVGEAGSDYLLTFIFNEKPMGVGYYTQPEALANNVLNGYNSSDRKVITVDIEQSVVTLESGALTYLNCTRNQ